MRAGYVTKGVLVAIVVGLGASPAFAYEGQHVGSGIGAALGGLLGSQIARGDARLATIAAGVYFGSVIGDSLGRSVEYAGWHEQHEWHERHEHHRPYYYAPVPAPVYYYAPAYRPNYVAPPAPLPVQTSVYYNGYGESYCREYSQQVVVGNHVQESYGTACLQPDGSWRIVTP